MADICDDGVGAKYMKLEYRVCFMDYSVFVVKLLVSEYNCSKVVEAKEKEIKKVEDYSTFEEVDEE